MCCEAMQIEVILYVGRRLNNSKTTGNATGTRNCEAITNRKVHIGDSFFLCVIILPFPIYFGDGIPRDVKSLPFGQILSPGPSFDLFPRYFFPQTSLQSQRGSTQRVLLLVCRQIGSLSSTTPRYTTTTAHINLHFLSFQQQRTLFLLGKKSSSYGILNT